MERWLITGACGQLGGHVTELLVRERNPDVVVIGAGRRRCAGRHGDVLPIDATNADQLGQLLSSFQPTHVVHLAGTGSPSAAERDPERTRHLDVTTTNQLAEHVAHTDSWMLYASSDFVWDGAARGLYSESDTPNPATFYGRSKLAGERMVLDRGAGTAARFSLLYGSPRCPRRTTWTRMMQTLDEGGVVPACTDEYRTPLGLSEAAEIVLRLGRMRHRGLLHVAGPEVLTPYGLLTEIALASGRAPRLRAISRSALGGGATRPRSVPMDRKMLLEVLSRYEPARVDRRDPAVGA